MFIQREKQRIIRNLIGKQGWDGLNDFVVKGLNEMRRETRLKAYLHKQITETDINV